MQASSTMLTMGTVLDRAHDHDVPVNVMVGGHWIRGRVAKRDSVGVTLIPAEDTIGPFPVISVIRLTDIQAVQIPADFEQRTAIER